MCKFKQGDQIIEIDAPFRKATVLMVTKQNYFIEWSGALSENVIPTEIVDKTFVSFPERTEVYEGTLYLIKQGASPKIFVSSISISDHLKRFRKYTVLDEVRIVWKPNGDFYGVRINDLKRGCPVDF